MAKVHAQVQGGSIKEIQADTVSEARSQLGIEANYQASVNGEPVDAGSESEHDLNDFEFLSFAPKVKGA